MFAQRKKTLIQEGELDVAGRELVVVGLTREAPTGAIGGMVAAKVGHQLLVVPGAIMVIEKPAINVPQVQHFVLLKL